jgi:hypothetical protein
VIDIDDPKESALREIVWLPDRLERYARKGFEVAKKKSPYAQQFVHSSNEALRAGKFLEVVQGYRVPWSNTCDWVAWQVGGTVKAAYTISALRDGVRAINEVLSYYQRLLAIEGQVAMTVKRESFDSGTGFRGMVFKLELVVIDTIRNYEEREKEREKAAKLKAEHEADEAAWTTSRLLLAASYYGGRGV